MQLSKISIKKQIQLQKIYQILNSYDVVLLFTAFYLPQKNRQVLKKGLGFSQLALPNNLLVNIQHKQNTTTFVLPKGYCLPETKPKQSQSQNFILHLHNKSAQHLEIFSGLPISGQTVLFAINCPEHAQHIYTSAQRLYKGVFLGGFYKNVYKDKKQYKALCDAIFHKHEIYKMLCRAMCISNYKNLRIAGRVKNKAISLLKLYGQKKDILV